MSRIRVLIVTVFVLAVASGCRGSGDEPGYVVTPGMVESVPWDPYDPNPLTGTGRTMMAPPEGTLPHGTMPHAFGASREETARAGRELANPVTATRVAHTEEAMADPITGTSAPVADEALADSVTGTSAPVADDAVVGHSEPSAAVLARGKWVYDTYCSVCHGSSGDGDGPIIGAGRFPNPPSLLSNHARELADGAIYNIVTVGQGLMPSYAVQVTPIDRWRVVHFVRKLQSPVARSGGAP